MIAICERLTTSKKNVGQKIALIDVDTRDTIFLNFNQHL